MEKLQGTSMDIVQDNIEKLKQIFPEVFAEGKIDFQVLKQLLGEYIENDKERYSFTWKGKTQARQIAQDTSTGTLRPDRDNSKDWENTENLYIEGDNLEVLKLLQKSYHGKIKMIYIDPPYNTGKDFVYKDNFRDNIDNYLTITGQKSENSTGGGYQLTTNTETSGRYHSDWLNMMYPRLKLARNLLTDDGSLFINIDYNEFYNLKKICDEIFGEENFQREIIWRIGWLSGYKTTASNFIRNHDTILFYSKNSFKLNFIKHYIQNKDFKPLIKKTPRVIEKFEEFGLDKTQQDALLAFINYENRPEKYPIEDTWNANEYDDLNSIAIVSFSGEKISKLLNIEQDFKGQKSIQMLKRIINSTVNKEEIILDFFSGTSSTAHAVMQLNAEDGGNRKYIMVQLPEVCDEKSEAYKAGYKNICEIGKERIRRAGEKVKSDETLPAENREKLDIGFKVFKLDSSNIKEWDSETEDLRQSLFDSIDNIKSDRTSLDILYEILLKYGLDLNVPIVENKHFYSIGGGTLLINLDKEIDMEVIDSICEEYKTLLEIDEDFKTTVVLRDSSFANDVDKTNAMKKLEQVGIKEVRSI